MNKVWLRALRGTGNGVALAEQQDSVDEHVAWLQASVTQQAQGTKCVQRTRITMDKVRLQSQWTKCVQQTIVTTNKVWLQALRATGSESVLEKLQEAVKEHAAWLEANMTQQLETYTDFVERRRNVSCDESEEGRGAAAADNGGAGSHRQAAALEVFEGDQPGSVAVAAEEGDAEADKLLEQRVRGVVRFGPLR